MIRHLFALLAALHLASLPMVQPAAARAATRGDKSDVAAIEKMVSIYQKSKSLRGFLYQMKWNMPEDHYTFLDNKAREVKEKGLWPKLEKKGPGSYMFKANGVLIPFEIVSVNEMKFKLNNKTVTFTPDMSVQQRWDLVIAALPSGKSASLMNLFVTEAHAMVGAVLMALNVFIGVLSVSLVGSTVNTVSCYNIADAELNCLHEVRRFFTYSSENLLRTNKGLDSGPLEHAQRTLKDLEKTRDALITKVVRCENEKKKLVECIDDLVKTAKDDFNIDLKSDVPAPSTTDSITGSKSQ